MARKAQTEGVVENNPTPPDTSGTITITFDELVDLVKVAQGGREIGPVARWELGEAFVAQQSG